ncbi:MAG: hypothetical protein NTZ09_08535 [Candidatus Hydrogenedentes bacterium]|nr:hypothetical protein [Candidatus Hydrogenedentota bacterium]
MMDKQMKELRDYAWSYFVVHADQRMKTFNFYLVVATLIGGVVVTVAKDTENVAAAGILSLLLPFLSFVFYKLDQRTVCLIKLAEAAMKLIENKSDLNDQEGLAHPLKLFLHEEQTTEIYKAKSVAFWWERPWSYSECFKTVFMTLGTAGLLAAIFLVCIGIR